MEKNTNETKSYNIIGDVAGRYNELMLLLEKMPKDAEVILLGDLNDRGPDSDKVIQWAIDNNIRCVKSNHGDMLVDHYNAAITGDTSDLYSNMYTHLHNGGHETLCSYGGIENVPPEHIEWLETRPYYIMENGLFLSHAPWHPLKELEEVTHNRDRGLTWNRLPPDRRDGLYQVHGHNTYKEVYKDELGDFGRCIDNSGEEELTGFHFPSMEEFTQPYLD